jgi:UDP-glucose 4-epimerase
MTCLERTFLSLPPKATELVAKKYLITGGAGFIGAHLANRILDTSDAVVTVFDNLATGRRWHFGERLNDPRLTLIVGDCRSQQQIIDVVKEGHDVVFHLASNSDIARAAEQPSIDFENGTLLTHNVLEAMRKFGIRRVAFTSGSGVYGEVPPVPIKEDYERMIPVSTYGACKLASEALISAYSFMFDMQGIVFRFANVVGPQQTHGVAYDFIQRLSKDPTTLRILGDGSQSKPYIHVDDVLDAFLMVEGVERIGYEYYNVASEDFLTVREIADIVVERMGLKNVKYEFTGGNRGWKADVPVYRLNTDKIRARGWSNKRSSRLAVTASVDAMIGEVRGGRDFVGG